MTTAKITKKDGYKCAPDGHTVVTVPFGATVDGQIAEWALADRAASRMFDPREETKVVAPDETKAKQSKRRKAPMRSQNVPLQDLPDGPAPAQE